MHHAPAYPVDLTPDDNDTLLVTCPDLPEVTSFGTDRDDALRHAANAIAAVIAHRVEQGQPVPEPSPANGRPVVALPTQTSLKLALHRAMADAGVNQVQLAQRLGCDPKQVRRLLDFEHASRLDQVDAAFAALGLQAVVLVTDRAA